MTDRVVVAITGASGIRYGVRALEMLEESGVRTHLVLTRQAQATAANEDSPSVAEIKALASAVHSDGDLGAPVASGSFPVAGMVVAPCSIKTLSGIANSYDDNLVVRAADVTLKERRPLVLLVRETPLHLGHLRLMSTVAEYGGTIMPPVPAFYSRPESVDDIVDHTVAHALELVGFPIPNGRPQWTISHRGPRASREE